MADVPAYDAYQSAFHTAFAADLARVVDRVPIPPAGRVLDVPCGNGFYSAMLARKLGPGGSLVAVDVCDEYLSRTRDRLAGVGITGVDVRHADAYRLPFAAAEFDVVWCAQSLVSLDPSAAVREMARVVRPDGVVVVLEADEFHHVLLSWPPELEAALPAAVLAASAKRYGDGAKLSPTRRLRAVLKAAGFAAVRRRTVAMGRAAPFDADTAAFLAAHVDFLRQLAYEHLAMSARRMFDRATDPADPTSVFRRPDAEVECLNVVYTARGRVPAGRSAGSGRG